MNRICGFSASGTLPTRLVILFDLLELVQISAIADVRSTPLQSAPASIQSREFESRIEEGRHFLCLSWAPNLADAALDRP